MSESPDLCTCHACVVANVDRPPITIPAHKGEPAKTLHGVELRKHYEAMDQLRAAIEKFKREKAIR
jgi:hypothetical protein